MGIVKLDNPHIFELMDFALFEKNLSYLYIHMLSFIGRDLFDIVREENEKNNISCRR